MHVPEEGEWDEEFMFDYGGNYCTVKISDLFLMIQEKKVSDDGWMGKMYLEEKGERDDDYYVKKLIKLYESLIDKNIMISDNFFQLIREHFNKKKKILLKRF